MNDKVVSINAGRPVVSVSEDSSPIQSEAVVKLMELQTVAINLRRAMDYCADHSRLEDMVANGLLVEATLAYSRRASCSVLDAREYISRVVAERAAKEVASTPAVIDTTQPE